MGDTNIDLSGKVALVTGGSRGLGKDIALEMAQIGAKVAICGRKKENLDTAVEEFNTRGLDLMAMSAHVGKTDQVKALMQAIEEKFGRLDILINNVGMNILTPLVVETDEGLWDKILESNLKGPFLVSSHASTLMKNSGGGKIVNISSTAARKGEQGYGDILCGQGRGRDVDQGFGS